MPWHPFAIAATIVITAWLDAAVSPFAAARPLLVALGLATVLVVIGSAITRSMAIGGLIASGVLVALWSRVAIEAASGLVGRMGLAIGLVWLALIAVIVALVLVRLRGRWTLAGVTSVLNRASLLLLVATLLLGLVGGRIPALLPDLQQGTGLDSLPTDADDPDLPDVYAILLDGYPREDVLEYAFDLDNSAFSAALEERGFEVADAAHSDYLWTHVSLPSALNMAYVEQIPAMAGVIEGIEARQPSLRRTVADGEAFEVAREAGYSTVAVASGFEEVALRQADAYLDGGQLNEFEVSLLTSTFADDLLRPIWPDLGSGQQRDRIRYNLDVLPEIAAHADDAPLFVFDHVPAPHQPIVFGEDGAPVAEPLVANWYADSPAERGQDPDEFRDRYRAQLPVINDLVLDAIDGILAESDEPPVILLFADHGSASAVDWNETDPAEADPARLLERTGTLFAALTPGRTGVYPADASPVDLYRLLFDAYLGTDYGRAEPPDGGGHVEPVDASVLDGNR